MTTEAFNALVNQDIQRLMQQPDPNQYVDTLASYLDADPALLRCMVHCQHLELSGNTLLDLRQAETCLKAYEFEQQAAVQSQQTKTY